MVLITGITGKSGMWMLERMSTESASLQHDCFRFSVRQSSNITQLTQLNSAPLNKEIVIGDLEDTEYCKNICRGADTLFHIAGISLSLQLVKIAADSGVKRFILVHTTGIYSKYKQAGEKYRQIEREINDFINGKDISITILRPTMIYGSLNDNNVIKFIKMVDTLRLFPVINKAEYELQPVWAKDLGDAYFQVLIHPEITKNKNYILSGGEPILLINMFKVIEKQLGKKNNYISVPYWFAYMLTSILYIITLGKKDFREKVQRLIEPRVYSHEEAANDFGYNPAAFKIGVKDEISEYMKAKS